MKTLVQIPLIVLSATLFISGCCTNVSTGHGGIARVKIETTDIKAVESQLTSFMTNGNFRETLVSEMGNSGRVIFSKSVNGTSGLFDQVAVESTDGQEATYDFELAQEKKHVRLTAEAQLSARTPAGEIDRQNMNQKWATDIEHALLNVKAAVEEQPQRAEIQKIYEQNKGRIGVAFDGAGYIVQLTPDGPGAKAGLRAGDRIVAVNHWPFSKDVDDKVEQLTGKPGSSVRITVLRDGKKMSFKMVRQ